MSATYTNWRGQTYYVHRYPARAGRTQLGCSMKAEGALDGPLPEGYEFYENPNGRVSVRRARPRIVHQGEIDAVDQGVRRLTPLTYFKVDVRGREIAIHTADQPVERIIETVTTAFGLSEAEVTAHVALVLTYSPVMKFVLVDQTARHFEPFRMSYFSSGEEWFLIGEIDTLPRLVTRFVPHLEQDSFFEL